MENNLDIKAFLDKDEQKDLLRFLTAGSVDDGKSTLIGRLLFDSKKLYEDQLDDYHRCGLSLFFYQQSKVYHCRYSGA